MDEQVGGGAGGDKHVSYRGGGDIREKPCAAEFAIGLGVQVLEPEADDITSFEAEVQGIAAAKRVFELKVI